MLVQGEEVGRFENELADSLTLPTAVAVNSGTAALHLALLALGIGRGDEVILPSYVCVAPLHAIEYVGATPRLADIDPRTYNLDPEDVKQRLNRRTRAIIVPHLFGLPADLTPLLNFDIPVVEDCAQALGARIEGTPVGSLGVMGITSFYATKLLTTGEGGALFSRSKRLMDCARDLRDYDERRGHRVRFNYKLTDFQAALGRCQLARFPGMLKERDRIARRYAEAWTGLPVALPARPSGCERVYHRFVLSSRLPGVRLIRALAAAGVAAGRPIFQPLHLTLKKAGFPGASEAFRHAVSVPLYPGLDRTEQARVIAALHSAFDA